MLKIFYNIFLINKYYDQLFDDNALVQDSEREPDKCFNAPTAPRHCAHCARQRPPLI